MPPPPPSDDASPPSPAAIDGSVVRSAGIVSAAVMASRLTGLVREIAFARLFGAGLAYDAYVAAFRLPNLFRDLLAEGALSAAFVTTFSQLLEKEGEEGAFRLSNRLATLLIPFVSFLCLVLAIFAPQLVDVVFPGFREVPGKKELTVLLARIMMPFLLFITLAAKAMGVLNARGIFGIPALASASFNVTSVAIGVVAALWIAPPFGVEPIVGMAWGTLLGGLMQYLWQLPSLRKTGLRYHFELAWNDPDVRQVIRLVGPAIIGAAAVQVNVVVNSWFASQISDASGNVVNGPVSWLGYAFRFMQLPLGVFGVALATATLPSISRSAAGGRMDEFRDTLANSLTLVFLLTIPSAVGLMTLATPIIGLIYQGGRFDAFDTEQTAIALAAYCLGLTAYAAIKILTPAYYALDEVRTPMTVSVVSIGANFGLNWLFIEELDWGHGGLALATAVIANLSFVALFLLLRARVGGIGGGRVLSRSVRILAVSALMGAACHFLSQEILAWFGSGFPGRLLTIAVCVPVGVAVVYSGCRLLRLPELDEAQKLVLARLPARFRRRN